MTNCAVGSVRGFDEIVRYGLNVVTETRKYRIPENYEGIIPAKSVLLNLHTKMAREGFIEINVHQEHDFISAHRVHPVTHDGYLMIARCAFSKHVSSEVHSPIVLINQAIHAIESAGLRVQAPMTHEDSHLHPPKAGPDGEDGLAISPNIVPLSMLVSPHDADAIAKSRDARSQLCGRKTLGAIAGLPSFLDFSAVLTTLAKAEQIMKRGFNNSEMIETVINIDPKHFLPGSVVVYRTWMVGAGMELNTPVQYPPVHPQSPQLASMLGSPYGRLHLGIPTSPIIRATSPDFRPKLVKKLTPAIPLIASTDGNGSTTVFEGEEMYERLLGLDNKNPELFNPNHARIALEVVKSTLVGPLGLKTLDPADWAYRGVFDNSNDSTDGSVAHGFNYHQGPEWVGVVGFFLQAYYYFNFSEPKVSKEKRFEVIYWIQRQLLKHKSLLADQEKNPFAGLPELTNVNGAFCHGSCPTQAWSSTVMIEAINSLLQ